jgi:hypothetical protein
MEPIETAQIVADDVASLHDRFRFGPKSTRDRKPPRSWMRSLQSTNTHVDMATFLSRLLPRVRNRPFCLPPEAAVRAFSTSRRCRTDGVFRALTGERVQKPWIEAFREQQAGMHGDKGSIEQRGTPADRDLTPKKMSDSYHSVVGETSTSVREEADVNVVGLAPGPRTMASGYVHECVWSYPNRNHAHGLGCSCGSGGLQTHW